MITFAKGATAGHAPLGGVLMSDKVAEPFVTQQMFMHGLTFGGHPLATAIAGAALDVYEREGVLENVRANEGFFEERLRELYRNPLVGDVRGAGYFWAVELVKDRATKETFEGEEADWLLRAGALRADADPRACSAASTTAATRSSSCRRRSSPTGRCSAASSTSSARRWRTPPTGGRAGGRPHRPGPSPDPPPPTLHPLT